MLSLEEIVARLREIAGPRRVSTDPIDKINYQHTLAYGAYRALPDVIVRIESEPDGCRTIAEILRFADSEKIPIVPRGGVGMGISSPLKGGILLDMLGMDRILEVDAERQHVVAEGGASVYAIHHALRRHGLMLPNFGTYGPAVVIGAMVNKGGIGYGMTRYGWIADLVIGLEVVLANGETLRLGALANQGTIFGPFQKWIHLPDLLGLFTLAAGSMGIITKVCLRAIEGRREWLHDYCYSFRREELRSAQQAMAELVKGEVVYDIHFTDRWQYHWPMEEGLLDRSRIPEDAWFFLKTVILARDEEEKAFKQKRMRRIYESAGAREVVEVAEKAMGARAQEHGLHGWPDYHIMGPDGWCSAVVRHAGMFAVTSKMYPLGFLSEMYDLDEAAKRECGLWDAEHAPQHDSYVTRDLAIKEEYFVFYNPYDEEDVARLRRWMGKVQEFSNARGVVWTAPTLGTKGPLPYQRLANLYDLVKEIKRLVDPNNILNPGAIY
ncbi:MAG TPA: FAD-binding oxidoreductase [candidate division Zixibacteria bacterium]|nr:FAD-binding oxidoreductase [candidate division Zixibacteria bacterium]